jgi:regulator of protease activity HflC (stomatin/prohibitin superfamily)
MEKLSARLPTRGKLGPSRGLRIGLIAAAVVIALIVLAAFTVQVDASESCAATRFGKVSGTASPGLHFRIPGVTSYHCYRTATTYYEVLEAGEEQTNADYISGPVDGVTIDGQQLAITFNVRYHVDPAQVDHIYADVGKTMAEINERVVKFHTRTISRQVANTKRADEMYLGNLAPISAEMRDAIAPRFTDAGLVLEFFELKRPNFSDEYEQAIESRQIAAVLIEQRRQETLVAEQEAEKARVQAQGEADADYIRAQGEAKSLAETGKAVKENPEILELERIRAIEKANVVYVPSDGILPVLDVSANPTDTPTAIPESTPTP